MLRCRGKVEAETDVSGKRSVQALDGGTSGALGPAGEVW